MLDESIKFKEIDSTYFDSIFFDYPDHLDPRRSNERNYKINLLIEIIYNNINYLKNEEDNKFDIFKCRKFISIFSYEFHKIEVIQIKNSFYLSHDFYLITLPIYRVLATFIEVYYEKVQKLKTLNPKNKYSSNEVIEKYVNECEKFLIKNYSENRDLKISDSDIEIELLSKIKLIWSDIKLLQLTKNNFTYKSLLDMINFNIHHIEKMRCRYDIVRYHECEIIDTFSLLYNFKNEVIQENKISTNILSGSFIRENVVNNSELRR